MIDLDKLKGHAYRSSGLASGREGRLSCDEGAKEVWALCGGQQRRIEKLHDVDTAADYAGIGLRNKQCPDVCQLRTTKSVS